MKRIIETLSRFDIEDMQSMFDSKAFQTLLTMVKEQEQQTNDALLINPNGVQGLIIREQLIGSLRTLKSLLPNIIEQVNSRRVE